MIGKIIKLLSGVYTVETPEGAYQCRAKGSFRKQGISPVPGDEVEILALPDHTGRIEKILPRRNYMIRPNVANVDILCYVSAIAQPTPFPFTIDKMLIIAKNQGITPILVFNKIDLPDDEKISDLADMYRRLRYSVYCVSASKGEGLDELCVALKDKTVVFAGNTGVGKSSLLNTLYPSLKLETGEVSQKLGRGRHTTRHIELYPVNGALIGDTPGFGALELEGYEIKSTELPDYFPEFESCIEECTFLDCSHISERDCGVRKAVSEGRISAGRYESYCQIYQYLKEGETPWSKKTSN
ncbi:MAG: ribosome small subunit-dependent GTPase A [Clostridia bacterium]|nr:ribosome small subunit-dependent GTPase A [Clostridia bacterium]